MASSIVDAGAVVLHPGDPGARPARPGWAGPGGATVTAGLGVPEPTEIGAGDGAGDGLIDGEPDGTGEGVGDGDDVGSDGCGPAGVAPVARALRGGERDLERDRAAPGDRHDGERERAARGLHDGRDVGAPAGAGPGEGHRVALAHGGWRVVQRPAGGGGPRVGGGAHLEGAEGDAVVGRLDVDHQRVHAPAEVDPHGGHRRSRRRVPAPTAKPPSGADDSGLRLHQPVSVMSPEAPALPIPTTDHARASTPATPSSCLHVRGILTTHLRSG